MTKRSNTDTPSSEFTAGHQVENQLGLIANKIDNLDSAAEAIAAIGDGGGAGLSWAAEKLGTDVMELQEAFTELRELVYSAAPSVKAEAARRAEIMGERF